LWNTWLFGAPDLVPVLLTGFDYLVAARLTRLLAEDSPVGSGVDPVEGAVDQLLPSAPPLGYLVAAVWRAPSGPLVPGTPPPSRPVAA
jgi:hypothetical protein